MNNSNVVQLMQQQEKPASGLDPANESIFIKFLIIIETTVGARSGLEVLQQSPDYYWSHFWSALTVSEFCWLVRVTELPWCMNVAGEWLECDPEARAHICKKTAGMAFRANDLISTWKLEFSQ